MGSSLDTSAPPPTTTTMQPTKFAKLLKVVMPIVQGGVAGMSADPRTLGGGMAAENFFQRQTENQIQQKELALRTQQQQSENQYRQAEGRRADALAQGAGRIYQADDATGERHSYRVLPDGSKEDLGKMTLPGKFVRGTDAGGVDVMDTRNGVISPVPDEEPEKHGNLPLPGEEETPQLQAAPPKPTATSTRPIAVGEGQELVDPKTGQVITPARPKTFAPRAPRAADEKKATQGKSETYADALLSKFNGNQDQAIAAVEQLKSLDPAMKAEVRKLIRDIKKPAPAKKFTPTADQMKRLAQAPPG